MCEAGGGGRRQRAPAAGILRGQPQLAPRGAPGSGQSRGSPGAWAEAAPAVSCLLAHSSQQHSTWRRQRAQIPLYSCLPPEGSLDTLISASPQMRPDRSGRRETRSKAEQERSPVQCMLTICHSPILNALR